MEKMKKIPVFVFPITLEFYLVAKHTHKQLLTLYNPYDFAVSFKVLCTSPNKFKVIDPEGVIGPRSCIDIVVRYCLPTSADCQTLDKFRVTMNDRTTNQVLGKRDVPVKFLTGEPENAPSEGSTENFQPLSRSVNLPSSESSALYLHTPNKYHQTNLIAVAVGILCIAALILPTQMEQQSESSLPSYLHLSVHLKLVLAFVLGLVSMVVLRPY